MQRRIAVVVDDDPEIGAVIDRSLQLAGFDVVFAASGKEALAAVSLHQPDLVTLDLTLPDVDGLEVCRRIRAGSDCYIIMVSARIDEVDRLTGLEVGADDFLTKPFSVRELQARVAALFRRPRSTVAAPTSVPPTPVTTPARARTVLDCGSGLEVDPASREVRIHGRTVDLTRTEFDLLAHLASRPGVVVGRDDVLRSVWATDFVPEDTHNVDVHLANLRRKLRRHSSATWIRTVRGVGLRLDRG